MNVDSKTTYFQSIESVKMDRIKIDTWMKSRELIALSIDGNVKDLIWSRFNLFSVGILTSCLINESLKAMTAVSWRR